MTNEEMRREQLRSILHRVHKTVTDCVGYVESNNKADMEVAMQIFMNHAEDPLMILIMNLSRQIEYERNRGDHAVADIRQISDILKRYGQ